MLMTFSLTETTTDEFLVKFWSRITCFMKFLSLSSFSHAQFASENQVDPSDWDKTSEHVDMFINIHFMYMYFFISETNKSYGSLLRGNKLWKVLRHPAGFQVTGCYSSDYKGTCKFSCFYPVFLYNTRPHVSNFLFILSNIPSIIYSTLNMQKIRLNLLQKWKI